MSSAQVFNVYQKATFDESIHRLETRTYYPFVKSFNNNDIIEIGINQGDAWLLMYESAIYIKGKLEKTAGAGTVGLVNNAGAFLFDSVTYDLNGKELDTVRDPGILSTLRGYLCYTLDDSRHKVISGWNDPSTAVFNNNDGSFSMWIPLGHLLNIFNEYKLAMTGKHIVRLVRARNDNNAILITSAENVLDTKAKITIETIELKVKHIVPNDIIKLDLLQAIRADKPIVIPYRKWVLHELPALKEGATKEIWAVKTSSSVESPRYVAVVFQTDRKNNSAKDPTLFDNINVSDIRLYLNSDYYPQERMRLDFTNNHFVEAFNAYTEFQPSYSGVNKKEPLLDYAAFKSHAVFVIDCSRRNEIMKSSTADVKLEIESVEGFPANTRAYCLIIHDCVMEYLPLSEIVRNIL